MPLAPFIRTDSGVHPMIDRAALLQFYHDLPLDVWNISSPSDLVGWEVLRERHGIVDRKAVPCDLFVWGTGKPPDRRLTRVGGTPWLPKRIPWPDIDGVVPSFLCQFDFRDSSDLVGELPGDLLLVFVAEEHTMLSADVERMRFLWVSSAETDVIAPRAAPRPTHPFEFVRAWGVRYRSVDVPTKWDRAYAIAEKSKGSDRVWSLPVLWGTKIGGVPYDSQSIQRAVPAGYLCQLVSIQPSTKSLWPWADRRRPLQSSSEHELMIGDLGELTFFLRDDGSISVDSACG
jgi:hypothetical protein